jgi:hypothetical protein
LTGGLNVVGVRYGAKYDATNRLTLPAAEMRRFGGCITSAHKLRKGFVSAGAPLSRPVQCTPSSRTGHGHLSGRGYPSLVPQAGCDLGAAYTLGGLVADAVPLLTQAVECACRPAMDYDPILRP